MELEALQESLQEIKATGATLVAVSPMREPYLRQMAEKNHLEFDLLRDEGNVVSAKFGLVFRLPDDLIELYKTFGADLVRFNGDDSWTLPMPARHSSRARESATRYERIGPRPPACVQPANESRKTVTANQDCRPARSVRVRAPSSCRKLGHP